jgi:hypothetical protein
VRTSRRYGTFAAIAFSSAPARSSGSSTSADWMPNDLARSMKSGLYGVPSGLVNSVPYLFPKYVLPTDRIVE